MPKPNFFIVGAPKCGTTSMYMYLSQHPEIYMSPSKEPHFFGGHRRSYTESSWDDYLSLFDGATDEKRIGESSTGYLYSEKACQRIFQYDSNAKIIIMLRNPVDMIYAWHSELLWQCVEDEADFRTALFLEPARKNGRHLPKTEKSYSADWRIMYRFCGRYAEHVERYLNVFGKDQVRIIIFEKFIQQTKPAYQSCLEFLGVDSCFEPQLFIANPNRYPRWWAVRRWISSPSSPSKRLVLLLVPQKIRRYLNRLTYYQKPRPALAEDLKLELTDYFFDDIMKLEQVTGIDLSLWKFTH